MAQRKPKSIELLEPLLVETFGLETLYEPTSTLKEWLNVGDELYLEDFEKILLDKVHVKLIKNMNHWNEEELKMQYISMIILLSYVDEPIKTYYDREISAVINDITVSCKADMMFSKGIGEMIKTPYFFLHEYKREKKYSGDPIGQMLAGMLIGQARSNNGKPMYGCYVQGRYWYFAILEGNQYSISNSYNSSEIEEAKHIIFILRKLRQIISETLMD